MARRIDAVQCIDLETKRNTKRPICKGGRMTEKKRRPMDELKSGTGLMEVSQR